MEGRGGLIEKIWGDTAMGRLAHVGWSGGREEEDEVVGEVGGEVEGGVEGEGEGRGMSVWEEVGGGGGDEEGVGVREDGVGRREVGVGEVGVVDDGGDGGVKELVEDGAAG